MCLYCLKRLKRPLCKKAKAESFIKVTALRNKEVNSKLSNKEDISDYF